MSVNDFLGRALASLQDTVAVELRNDLRSGRQREYAACAGRVLARMQVDAAAAPGLAREHLQRWRHLTVETPAAAHGTDPLAELYAHATQIGRRLHEEVAPAATWFKDAVAATLGYLDAVEHALPEPGAKLDTERAPPDDQQQRLSGYLAARFPSLPADAVRSLRVVPGGRGKETSLIELVPNELLPSRLVLRRDLTLSVTGTSAYAEFPLLQAVEALGLPLPTPRFSRNGIPRRWAAASSS